MDARFFSGQDLEGWQGDKAYWSAEDGVIVGRSTEPTLRNEFLFSQVPVEDFHLSVWVRLTPDDRNSGIQFRSQRDAEGHAVGYQADVGRDYWGRLYDEHNPERGELDWTDAGEKHVRPGDWNHYEILAVGHRIWTAINGHLSVALEDPDGASTGFIGFQIHSGSPQEVRFRNPMLRHNPPVRMAGLNEQELTAALRSIKDAEAAK